jgi:hypothetical protein
MSIGVVLKEMVSPAALADTAGMTLPTLPPASTSKVNPIR